MARKIAAAKKPAAAPAATVDDIEAEITAELAKPATTAEAEAAQQEDDVFEILCDDLERIFEQIDGITRTLTAALDSGFGTLSAKVDHVSQQMDRVRHDFASRSVGISQQFENLSHQLAVGFDSIIRQLEDLAPMGSTKFKLQLEKAAQREIACVRSDTLALLAMREGDGRRMAQVELLLTEIKGRLPSPLKPLPAEPRQAISARKKRKKDKQA